MRLIKVIIATAVITCLAFGITNHSFAASYGEGVYGTGVYGGTTTTNSSSGSTSSPGNSSSTGGCANSAPTSPPDLFQADRLASEAILYFTPVSGNVNNYNITYGLSINDNRYGASFPAQTGGANKVIISGLSSQTTYYFTVRAGNGCALGPMSNTIKVGTAGKGKKVRFFKTKNSISSSFFENAKDIYYKYSPTISKSSKKPTQTKQKQPQGLGIMKSILNVLVSPLGFFKPKF